MGEHANNHFVLDLSALQQLRLEDLLKSFTGLQSWNDLLTLSELTGKVSLSLETKSLYTVRTFDDGRTLMDLSKMNDQVQHIELSSAEKRMLLRTINESVSKLTCADVEWISSIRRQVAE
jgi:hypothetical protein